MADRQYEAVSVGPDWMLGIESQHTVQQTIGHWCESHSCPCMTGSCSLHSIHGKRSDGVDARLVDCIAWGVVATPGSRRLCQEVSCGHLTSPLSLQFCGSRTARPSIKTPTA